MGIKVKFDDILTFLSLKNPDEVLKVIFKGKKGQGELVYRDGNISKVFYGDLKGDEALEQLLEEDGIEVMEMGSIFSYEGMSLLASLIQQQLGNLDGFLGMAMVDEQCEPYNIPGAEFPEISLPPDLCREMVDEIIRKAKSLMPALSEREWEGQVVIGARLKPELVAFVGLSNPEHAVRVKNFLGELQKITA